MELRSGKPGKVASEVTDWPGCTKAKVLQLWHPHTEAVRSSSGFSLAGFTVVRYVVQCYIN